MPVENTCITTEGVTVEEAVSKALKALRISREQAKIEILDEGKHGFLGMGARSAKVKVCVKEEAIAEIELSDLLVALDIKDEAGQENYRPKVVYRDYGVAAVENGELIITNPVAEGKYATVSPGKHVNLLINGKKVEDETYISEEDKVHIELVNDDPVNTIELKLSEDKVEARIRLIRRPGANYRLKDQPRTNKLILLTEVAEVVEPPPVTPDDIKKFLQDNNIIKGIYQDVIEQVIANPNSKESFLIAQGQKPVDGVDACVRCLFLEHKSNEEEGLFGRNKVISVSKGDVIAIKVPPREGVDGWTVTGEQVKARPAVDCSIIVKGGCDLVDNGRKVVASIDGRPVVEYSGQNVVITVEPVLELKNIDNTTGDIKFSGDVRVLGDVRDGYKVEATGNIEVLGDVTRATLKARGSVTVHKMVLGSTIVAGGLAALYTSIMPLCKEIRDLLDKTYTVALQLKQAPGFKTSDLQTKGDGQLIQLLIDSKFHNVSKAVGELVAAVSSEEQVVHEEVTSVVNLLHKSLCGLGPLHLEKIDYLLILIKGLDQVTDFISNYMLKTECITARYVQNSTLQSSGDIIIEGQGCYISTVTAGAEVIVAGNPGIARGVKIVAGRNVTIKELGSEFDTQTSVTIKGNGKFSAELIHPNVMVQIGTEKCRVDNLYRNFEAYVNHEGRLITVKLKAEEHKTCCEGGNYVRITDGC